MVDNTNENEWITVSYNKKKSNNTKNELNKKPRIKKMNNDFDKTKVNLWYDDNSWQHNVLINNYKYEDEVDVLSKFNLFELTEEYSKAKTNYDKNGIVRKLTKVLNDEKWKEEAPYVILKVKLEDNIVPEEKAEEKTEVLEEKTEALEEKTEVNKQHIFPKARVFDSSISFADMIKKN